MFLDNMINSYINDQWVNYRKDLNYPQAREELLSCGELHFFEKHSSTPKYVFQDEEECVFFPTPMLADVSGIFSKFHFPKNAENTYTIQVKNKAGEMLAIVDCGIGFEI